MLHTPPRMLQNPSAHWYHHPRPHTLAEAVGAWRGRITASPASAHILASGFHPRQRKYTQSIVTRHSSHTRPHPELSLPTVNGPGDLGGPLRAPLTAAKDYWQRLDTSYASGGPARCSSSSSCLQHLRMPSECSIIPRMMSNGYVCAVIHWQHLATVP